MHDTSTLATAEIIYVAEDKNNPQPENTNTPEHPPNVRLT